jgi:hypothetical protein
LGNGSFADFLSAISVNFIESGARKNRGPILAILPINSHRNDHDDDVQSAIDDIYFNVAMSSNAGIHV